MGITFAYKLIGISDNEGALDEHFVIAPTFSRLVQRFQDYAAIESRKPTSLHHELVGGKGEKILETATKLVNVLGSVGVKWAWLFLEYLHPLRPVFIPIHYQDDSKEID